MDNKVNKAIAPVDEVLPPQQLFILGLQHVLAMCAGAVAVPLIVGGALNLSAEQTIFLINADLFVAGIATLVQSLGIKNFIGAKVPVIEGASFASVSAMIAIANTYPRDPITAITTIFGATFVAGLFCFIMAPFFGKLIRFFPKVVTGTVITIIGISLLPVAVRWCAGNDVNSSKFTSPKNILLALFVLILILIMYKFFKGILGNISILLGIVVGTIVASMLGMSDFSRVHSSGWINIDIPLYFGALKFNLTAIISMILVMLVMMTEATGNMIAIHEMVGKDIDDKNLTRGLRTDGFATMLAGIFNTFPHTAFGQNVGLVNLTGIKSRFVVAASGGILILLGLFPKAGAVVASIPYPVLGGAGIAMFGMVTSGGISSLSKVEFNGTKNGMIIAVSIGLAMIPLAVPTFYSKFPQWVETLFHSGITTGSLTAILLNLFFNELGKNKNLSVKDDKENSYKIEVADKETKNI
ncbi:nucleobase:cation symporter-2 family protein [Clostridium botulinum]|uniref:nucleobase:cation symporter-2 family protein n=1 Tax=Clostridium botulinum TaxID=1491 RepID=UPI0007743930|nr:nucleobase:cation symporter-2 family protein [Clostridium botulinum]APQ99339.1 xanthine permease family protein [Clostridium botulinum]APU58148.1 xanthine permease family protein [Clostridium botulinum]AUN04325.1 uracil permease [Clostridium botulinum]MBN3396316.1 uracil permease [Clostridium botulinum]MBN3411510.1 uracil permease [Clostridium botulinum]